MSDLFTLTLQDKLFRTKYEPDTAHPHIEVKDDLCLACPGQPCLFFCPAAVYTRNPNDPKRIHVSHENCLECGTCIHACPPKSIQWHFPDGGLGVKYRYG
jgi:ferredoxin like protein